MRMAIDIGNTRAKIGLFEDEVLKEKWVVDQDLIPFLEKVFKKITTKRIILASVKKEDLGLKAFLETKGQFMELDATTPLPFDNNYKTPTTLGKDRIASIAGAQSIFPEGNVLVIDAGTCIKYDFLTKDSVYKGGTIAPGIKMRLKAMHHFTAKLPLPEMEIPEKWYGVDTNTSLLTGAFTAAGMEAKGFIEAYSTEYGPIKVILTGGDSDFFVSQLKNEIFVHSNLILIGLNKILSFNE